MASNHRACFRRAVTVRADAATAQGQAFLGRVRNLSLQGLYLERVGRHGTPELAPGDLLTAAFTLPSGRPCKVHGTVVRRDRQGWGVQFQEVLPYSLTNLHRYWAALD
jgi:hypothetical protein